MTWFSPRVATLVVLFLTLVIVVDVLWASTHRRPMIETRIDDCALVLTREHGPVCR